jgi:imidazolonepropionase-like amidohydrolase
MQKAGVKMGFGTDLVGAHHTRRDREFTLRREVLTPFQILESATTVNADLLQMEGQLGVVRPGALADILVLERNPLKDLQVLTSEGRYMTHIMKGGRFFKRP